MVKTMKILNCLYTATLSTLLLLSSTSSFAKGEVVELTSDNFEHLTQAATGQTTGKWFVKFYAPWCGHCKRLTPVWDELASKMETENPNDGIIIAKIDVTTNRDVGTRFGIKGFPTLMFFAGRKMFSYQGDRSIEALSAYVTGGYLENGASAGKAVPSPPGWFAQQLNSLRKQLSDYPALNTFIGDLDEILTRRKNAAGFLLVIGIIYGTLFGVVLGLMTKRGKEKTD